MPTYKTPGVFVEEKSTLPPSVAEVSTAVPAFIGYTEKRPVGETPAVLRINTLLEFEQQFGGPCPTPYTIAVDLAGNLSVLVRGRKDAADPEFLLYYQLSHHFKNGGGSCYIVSVGDYSASPTKAAIEKGIERLALEDEPTLILLTDAVSLKAVDYHDLCKMALAQCQTLGDRFAIFDVKRNAPPADDVQIFRDGMGTKSLAYGAAYYPYLETTLSYAYDETTVLINLPSSSGTTSAAPAMGQPQSTSDATLASLKSTDTGLYNRTKAFLATQRVTLPSSGAIAGIYASTDRERGVWKAPANVSITAVIGPVKKITDDTQESLNVDPSAGKSINAIRAFSGKGTLVWGARTLAGNDNEWRYISVRRLFIMIEESARKSTAFAVFEPNDLTTWLKVKGMIDSFLYGLWERGGLAGSKAESAYFVNVGLGKTMTSQDILEGRMIVEIGIAAVRPAEFIILRFSHKLQEA